MKYNFQSFMFAITQTIISLMNYVNNKDVKYYNNIMLSFLCNVITTTE